MSTFVGRWTCEQVEEAGAMWRAGVSLREIAERLGRSRSAVGGITNRHRELFPRRNEHLHRVLTEVQPEPRKPKAKPNPKPAKKKLSRILAAPLTRPTVFRTVKSEPTKDALRAMLHAAVLNTR